MAYRRLLTILVLSQLLVAAPALAGADPTEVGRPGAQSQHCVMGVVGDLTLTGDLHCLLELRASGVTVDLAGFTLYGGIRAATFGIRDVVIRDGRVEGFIELAETGDVEVRGLALRAADGAALSPGHRTRVVDSRVEDSPIGVLLIEAWSSGATIERSVLVGNDFAVLTDAPYTRIVDNRFVGNRVAVRVAEVFVPVEGTVVARNRFDRNEVAVQLLLRPEVPWREPVAVAANRIARSGEAGIDVRLFPGFADVDVDVAGNHVMHGSGDGVRVRTVEEPGIDDPSPAGVTVAANHAFHNDGFGIHAPGVTDGGRNHAQQNGEPAQCVGVDCRPPGRR